MLVFYKTTNRVNGKVYYGIHNGTSDDGYLGSGVAIQRAIEKYGAENFCREDLKQFDTEESAYEYEAHMVTEEVVNDPNTYNMTLGGRGGFSHIDNRGERNPMKDKSVARKQILRAVETKSKNQKYADIARNNLKRAVDANRGKQRSESTKRKISEANKGRVCSEYTKMRVRESRLGKEDSLETKMKKSESAKARFERLKEDGKDFSQAAKGSTRTEIHRTSVANAKKDWWKDAPLIECPHCGKKSKSKTNMNRWHFDNCKKGKQ